MRVLIIFDPQNTFLRTVLPNASGWFKKDGDEFNRQAAYCGTYYREKGYRVDFVEVSGKNAFDKRQNLFKALKSIETTTGYDRIIFFMHGAKYNLNRKMVSSKNWHILARLLARVGAFDCSVVLFSCWTGAVHQGFAERLAALAEMDVIAHATRGHTTRNPYKVRVTAGNALVRLYQKGVQSHHAGSIKRIRKVLSESILSPFEYVESVIPK